MVASTSFLRIGIFGPEEHATNEGRGCSLWATGYAAALSAAGAVPVSLGDSLAGRSWSELLGDLHGLVWTGQPHANGLPTAEEESLCKWCRKNQLPLLAVDHALLTLNIIQGGLNHLNLPTERPEALQHRHPPERGLRHAIAVLEGTTLADIYGEGELVVNSEHRGAVSKVARGFRVSAQALDGIIEAIEAEGDRWFVLGVQWRPASVSASGLDIQLFRGLLDACERRTPIAPKRAGIACTAA